jgi:cytochrome o ubiquinol oxidase operon protein cyoD
MEALSEQNDSPGRASPKSYLTGFMLALVLTVIPFGLVASGAPLSRTLVEVIIALAAGAQTLVHLYYFLHMNASAGARWNLLAVLFTALILVILAGGTLWIMVNLHNHMLPV